MVEMNLFVMLDTSCAMDFLPQSTDFKKMDKGVRNPCNLGRKYRICRS
jgi:hypothetical protein